MARKLLPQWWYIPDVEVPFVWEYSRRNQWAARKRIECLHELLDVRHGNSATKADLGCILNCGVGKLRKETNRNIVLVFGVWMMRVRRVKSSRGAWPRRPGYIQELHSHLTSLPPPSLVQVLPATRINIDCYAYYHI